MSRDRDEYRGGRDRDRDRDDDDRSSRRGGGRGAADYEYRRPDKDEMKRRAEARGGDFDSIWKQQVQSFTPVEGDNIIRILPPTWPDAKSYGYDVYVHYGIGPDEAAYLCLDKMLGKACPICEARARATRDRDEDYAKELKPNQRVAMYIIDRDREKEGPLLWTPSWTMDRDIIQACTDRRTGEMYYIDDPENGYDLSFIRQGKGLKSRYSGYQIDRTASDLGRKRDEWMKFIIDNPIPDLLNFYDYDHIAKVFSGADGRDHSSDSGSDRGSTTRGRDHGSGRGASSGRERDHARNDSGASSSGRRRMGGGESNSDSGSRDAKPAASAIKRMTFDQMSDLVEQYDLDIKPDETANDEELAQLIITALDLEEPAREERRPSRDRDRDRDDDDRLSRRGARDDDDDDRGSAADRLRRMRERR